MTHEPVMNHVPSRSSSTEEGTVDSGMVLVVIPTANDPDHWFSVTLSMTI